MTQLNALESALFLAEQASDALKGVTDLRAQLADVRLVAAIEALRGAVDMKEYERKMIYG